MGESAAEFAERDRRIADWRGPRNAWSTLGPLDVAFTLEALGATPDGFARVLRLVGEMRANYAPAGLSDVAQGYRIGVADPGSSSGEPLGLYRGVAIVAWTVSPGASQG
jgi:hypothetical protein